jgi:hypothetical protein
MLCPPKNPCLSLSAGLTIIVAGLMAFTIIAMTQWVVLTAWNPPQTAAGIAGILFSRTEGWWSLCGIAILAAAPWIPFIKIASRNEFGSMMLPTTIVIVAGLITLGGFSSCGYPWSADEYCALWQSQIFGSGAWNASYAPEWEPHIHAAGVFLRSVRDLQHHWMTNYLPGHALLLTPFTMTGVPWLLNPLLTGLGAIFIDRIGVRIGMGRINERCVTLLLYASSGQILAYAGTMYANPAHVTANLLWLLLFLKANDGCRWSLFFLPLVGGFALLLHKPFHAIFVAPFLLRITRTWSWKTWPWIAICYGSAWMCMRYWNNLTLSGSYEKGITTVMSNGIHPECLIGVVQIWTWQPLVIVLAIFSISKWREFPPLIRDIATGMGICVILISLRQDGQGHGWGSRYAHPLLGGLALWASWSWWKMRTISNWREPLDNLVLIGIPICLGIAVLRLNIIHSTVLPYYNAYSTILKIDADVVALPKSTHWLAHDLRRNNPWMNNRPIILQLDLSDPAHPIRSREKVYILDPVMFDKCNLQQLGSFPLPNAH